MIICTTGRINNILKFKKNVSFFHLCSRYPRAIILYRHKSCELSENKVDVDDE